MSGGALRGLECHTGILQACQKLGLKADIKFTVSAGAVIGTLDSAGYTGTVIEEKLREIKVSDLMEKRSFWQWRSSIYDNTGTQEFLGKLIGDSKIYGDVICYTTQDGTNETIAMPACKQAILASSAVPQAFEPVLINGKLYRDGGIRDNIPMPKGIDRESFDKIIVFVTNEDPSIEEKQKTTMGKIFQWLDLITLREYDQIVNDWQGFPNVCIIKPPPFESSLFSFTKDYALIKHARDYAEKKLAEFLKV